jgi:DNA polymerase III delta prime subunit
MSSGVPFVEQYRPKKIDDIVLDPINKRILTNIIETSYFPNLLFYGPPGTGKTTTIINLINAYQDQLGQRNKELMIHLNASDERGIDIIRSQISQFVNSKTLFNVGMKFVILDEVDYMTKNAQQALRYLLQTYCGSVRFCLICNYISRIDEGLQNEFLRLRFNQLPKEDIIKFLNNISSCENLNLSNNSLCLIQKLYGSDIRSMINFIQSNQNIKDHEFNIIDETVWNELYNKCIKNEVLPKLIEYINTVSTKYNMDKKNIINSFLNYIIRYEPKHITSDFLKFIEYIIHFEECKTDYYINFSLIRLAHLLKDS